MIKYLKKCAAVHSYWFLFVALIIVIGTNGIQAAPVYTEIENNNNNPLIPDIRVRREAPSGNPILSALPIPIDSQTIQRIIQLLTSIGQQIFNPVRTLAGFTSISGAGGDDASGSDGGNRMGGGPLQLINRLSRL